MSKDRNVCPTRWRVLASLAALLPPLLDLMPASAAGPLPVLKRSDVVFMYESDRQTYEDYGATVLAWGGRPTPKSREAARGITFFGSVGMVTEFARYHDRFPETYEAGLCHDLEGKPFKVPWLTDHQHQGIPYWWCCTQQPFFRQYVSERVAETVKAGADGVHIDDHLGSAGALWLGGCFCDRCAAGFRDYLNALPAAERTRQKVPDPVPSDFRRDLRTWLAADTRRKMFGHPLWDLWRTYQCRAAADFMLELRRLAAETAQRPVPMGANAGLLSPPHLSDYQALDLFSAEIEHHAARRCLDDTPLVAYRLAEAVDRPLTSTASGQDWAFIKEQNLPGLVSGWIALSYAAGQSLMVPHRQWCYTPEKGTHWYAGPKEVFAPLYRFVRTNAALFDGYETLADLTVAVSHRTFTRDRSRLFGPCNRLASSNVSYRLLLGGDAVVDHPLPANDLRRARRLLVLEPGDFTATDQQTLAQAAATAQRFESVEQALRTVTPAVRVEADGVVRALPRVKPGSAVVHLVNYAYGASRDSVEPLRGVKVRLDRQALGVPTATRATLFTPGASPVELQVQDGAVTIPELRLWAVLRLI